jgi:hypothetical protein
VAANRLLAQVQRIGKLGNGRLAAAAHVAQDLFPGAFHALTVSKGRGVCQYKATFYALMLLKWRDLVNGNRPLGKISHGWTGCSGLENRIILPVLFIRGQVSSL